MSRTPGFIIPSSYSTKTELEQDLRQRSKASGFTPFDPSEFSEDDIKHYGVKGMHWGVRKGDSGGGGSAPAKMTKAELNKPHADYSSRERTKDALRYPSGGVKRINQRLNKGANLKTARKKEGQRTLLKAAGVVALYNAPKIINAVDKMVSTHGANTMSSIRVKAQTNRGRAQAAATMGLPRKSTNGPAFAKKTRGGVHNITSL